MNRRKVVLSTTLGLTLTVALLVAFNLAGRTAMARTGASKTLDPTSPGEATDVQDRTSTAHVVVQFSEGDTSVRPITWTGTISRVAALEAAGLDVVNSGDTVCSIEGDGCPAADCFCLDNLWAQGVWSGMAWDTGDWPPPNLADGDVVAFRNATQPDFSDWGLEGFLPGAPVYVAASDALDWMRGQQQSDGSYPSWAGPAAGSVRALITLGSAGYDPDQWGSPSLLDFLTEISKTETVDYAGSGAAEAGRLAIGAAWTGQTVTDFVDINLPISITTYYSPTSGAFGDGSGDTAWAMLGLHAAGEDIPDKSVGFLKDVQNPDGGWAWNEWGPESEVQHTALCLQALLAAGEPVTSTEIADALAYIDSGKNGDRGYGYMVGDSSGVNTTAYVIQGLLSAGEDSAGNWCTSITYRYLLSAQQPDGSFESFAALHAVQEAVPALMHRPYGPSAAWTYNCYGTYLPWVTDNVSAGR